MRLLGWLPILIFNMFMGAKDKAKIRSAYLQGNLQPIHAAVTKGHLNVVQLFIDAYGIDPAVKSKVNTKA